MAISNSRLVSLENDCVSFRWKDYAHGGKQRMMTLSALEFLRRFLLHVLPAGIQRLRRYGFLANGHGQAKLELCRRLLQRPSPAAESVAATSTAATAADAQEKAVCRRCPICGAARLRMYEEVPRPSLRQLLAGWPFDTS